MKACVVQRNKKKARKIRAHSSQEISETIGTISTVLGLAQLLFTGFD